MAFDVVLCVVESFGQLRQLEASVPPAFKVKVVYDDSMAAHPKFGNECDAPPKPLLKRFRARQEPLWFPEAGLMTKMNYSGVFERPT